MSTIGSAPEISGPISETAAVRPVGTASVNAERLTTTSAPAPTGAPVPGVALPTTAALAAGPVPIDHSRVADIQKAIRNHSYPLIPARISDAMIAAGLLLRVTK